MVKIEPLSPEEEALWRALMRIIKTLPRRLESDLTQGTGLSASEHTTIMHLLEAPARELRMNDLASDTGLSPSRMTTLGQRSSIPFSNYEDGESLRCPRQRGQAHSAKHGKIEDSRAGALRKCSGQFV
jgi:hypothetical protein